jgi:hypothetical protein
VPSAASQSAAFRAARFPSAKLAINGSRHSDARRASGIGQWRQRSLGEGPTGSHPADVSAVAVLRGAKGDPPVGGGAYDGEVSVLLMIGDHD